MTKEDNIRKSKGSSQSKASPSRRSSSRPKKTVDYIALQDVKIENDEDDSDYVEEVTPPPKKNKKSLEKKTVELVTEGKCGQCAACQRNPCRECSFCKNGDTSNCIDLYCPNDRQGRDQRQAAREAYLLSIGGQDKIQNQQTNQKHSTKRRYSSDSEGFDPIEEDLSIKAKIDEVMANVVASQKGSKENEKREKVLVKEQKTKAKEEKKLERKKPGPRVMGIYGGSSKAAKSRRCGECEGCMRDDCGQCQACADKPRFGGPGTKKKACIARYCRMRKAEEDHAQANFPLNSPNSLNTPRPASSTTKKQKVEEGFANIKSEIEDEMLL